jgi:dihydroflavonol-4-reductase
VTEPETLAPAFEGITHVYHVAAALGSGRAADRHLLQRVNVEGTRHVVDAALRAGVRRLVHTSSMAAFGRPADPSIVLDESAAWSPSRLNGPYAASKHRAELEVQRGIAEGLDAVIVNPSLVFGIGRPGENTVRIVELVRDRRLPAAPVGGTNVVDARDVAEGHIRAMERGRTGERYFLGSQNLAWTEILGLLAAAFGVPAPRRTVGPRMAQVLGLLFEARGRVTGRAPALTRERARQTAAYYHYRNEKAVRELEMTFRPFRETAQLLAATFGARMGAS